MKLSSKAKTSLLLIGDIAALYLALLCALAVRYGTEMPAQLAAHLMPFSIAFALWLLVFYIAGLYDLRRLRNNIEFVKTLSLALFVSALLTIALFYLVQTFGIAPRRILFLLIIIFSIIEVWWRRAFNIRAAFRDGLNRVLLLGNGSSAEEISNVVKHNPQIGYEIVVWLRRGLNDPEVAYIRELVARHDINLIAIPHGAKSDHTFSRPFYNLLASGIQVVEIPVLYEMVFRKVPLQEISESWFIENRVGERRFYDELKRGLELATAILLTIVLSPFMALVALAITLTSRGPVIYRQIRIGQGGAPFTFYKFRTMYALGSDGSAELSGARWTPSGAGDERTTPVGKLLRYTHLDELPQLANIIKGELSFVGPRPERPEFIEKLKAAIPYYEIRLLAKPGVTGWAQINHRADTNTDDVKEKLSFDIYYIKNRSVILDLAIIIKTLKTLFVNPK